MPSTTQLRLLDRHGLAAPLRAFVASGKPRFAPELLADASLSRHLFAWPGARTTDRVS